MGVLVAAGPQSYSGKLNSPALAELRATRRLGRNSSLQAGNWPEVGIWEVWQPCPDQSWQMPVVSSQRCAQAGQRTSRAGHSGCPLGTILWI